jgi:hypothetical protein
MSRLPGMLGQISLERILLSTLTKGQPMKLNISINLDNAAFEDNCDQELSHIFGSIVKVLQAGTFSRAIQDSNGNTVGNFTMEDK